MEMMTSFWCINDDVILVQKEQLRPTWA